MQSGPEAKMSVHVELFRHLEASPTQAAGVLGYALHAFLPVQPSGAPPCLSYVHFGKHRLPFVPNVTHKPGELGSSGPSQKCTAAFVVIGLHPGTTHTAVGKKS